jgi:hypothetical protein
MKLAVVGSGSLTLPDGLEKYLLPEITRITEILYCGPKGVGLSARKYALTNDIKLTEFSPQYHVYGYAGAQFKRNVELLENADFVLAFWDGESQGTELVIKSCRRSGTPIKVIRGESI